LGDFWLAVIMLGFSKHPGKTLYQVRSNLFGDYLQGQLRNPQKPAFQPAQRYSQKYFNIAN